MTVRRKGKSRGGSGARPRKRNGDPGEASGPAPAKGKALTPGERMPTLRGKAPAGTLPAKIQTKLLPAAPKSQAEIKAEHDEMVLKLVDFYAKEGHDIVFASAPGYEKPPMVEGYAPDVITQYYRFPILAEIGRCDTSGIDAMVERMRSFYRQRMEKPNTRLHFAAHEECLYPYQRRFAEAGIIVDRYIPL